MKRKLLIAAAVLTLIAGIYAAFYYINPLGTVRYPAGWPFEFAKAPPDSFQPRKFPHQHETDIRFPITFSDYVPGVRHIWSSGFFSAAPTDRMKAKLEQELSARDWYKIEYTRDNVVYLSPDGIWTISLFAISRHEYDKHIDRNIDSSPLYQNSRFDHFYGYYIEKFDEVHDSAAYGALVTRLSTGEPVKVEHSVFPHKWPLDFIEAPEDAVYPGGRVPLSGDIGDSPARTQYIDEEGTDGEPTKGRWSASYYSPLCEEAARAELEAQLAEQGWLKYDNGFSSVAYFSPDMQWQLSLHVNRFENLMFPEDLPRWLHGYNVHSLSLKLNDPSAVYPDDPSEAVPLAANTGGQFED